MGILGKKNLLSSITAVICIVLYGAAIVYGAGRVLSDSQRRDVLAQEEFNNLIDRVSSAAILGFMSKSYQTVIDNSIMESKTILGVIISGSNGEFGFERQYGSIINWIGNSPRFKTGFGISGNYLFKSVWIDGQRNTTVQAIYSYIDYDFFIRILKETLIFILVIMVLAVLVLILDINLKNLSPEKDSSQKTATQKSEKNEAPVPEEEPVGQELDEGDPNALEFDQLESDAEYDESKDDSDSGTSSAPKGLYSSRGIGWESYTSERLESELHRCASLEEDLVFMEIQTRNAIFDEEAFSKLITECTGFFTLRDMIFEKDENGLSLIIPAVNLDQALAKSEEFRNRIQERVTASSGIRDIYIGLSSRSGRLVEAERLIMEADEALSKAKDDPESPIVAFRSDPEKYRKFIRNKLS